MSIFLSSAETLRKCFNTLSMIGPGYRDIEFTNYDSISVGYSLSDFSTPERDIATIIGTDIARTLYQSGAFPLENEDSSPEESDWQIDVMLNTLDRDADDQKFWIAADGSFKIMMLETEIATGKVALRVTEYIDEDDQEDIYYIYDLKVFKNNFIEVLESQS